MKNELLVIMLSTILLISSCATTTNHTEDFDMIYFGYIGYQRVKTVNKEHPEISGISYLSGKIVDDNMNLKDFIFEHHTQNNDTLKIQSGMIMTYKSMDKVSFSFNIYSNVVGFEQKLSPNIIIRVEQKGQDNKKDIIYVFDRIERDFFLSDGVYTEESNVETYNFDVENLDIYQPFTIKIIIENTEYYLNYVFPEESKDKIVWKLFVTK